MAGGIDSIKKVQAAEERAKGIVEHAARKRDADRIRELKRPQIDMPSTYTGIVKNILTQFNSLQG